MKNNGSQPPPDPGRIAYLIDRFLRDALTETEHDELDAWIEAAPENMRLFEELTDEENLQTAQAWFQGQEAKKRQKKKRYRAIQRRTPGAANAIIWYVAAACVIGISLGLYFFIGRHPDNALPTAAHRSNENEHNENKAVLILANGQIVSLDSSQQLKELGVTIKNGIITHTNTTSLDTGYNTVRVPPGDQFKIALADGSVVWLNAGTTLRYPASFGKQSRRVVLAGEAYFDVHHDAAHPFTVTSNEQEVTVLDTQFNVSAYRLEKPATTLVKGLVQVTSNGYIKYLHPGEQSNVSEKGIVIGKVNTEEVTAWKEGLFLFRSAPIETVAAQLERWYDLEIVYKAKPKEHFNATVKRTESLQRVLEVLEGSGYVHFKTEGRKLIIQR